jgi:hypothetical protein
MAKAHKETAKAHKETAKAHKETGQTVIAVFLS